MKFFSKSRLRKMLFLGTVEDLTNEERRKLWPKVPALKERHLKNCRLFPNRVELLSQIPSGGVCAEVGVFKCDYTKKILDLNKPKKLHLFDFWDESKRLAEEYFPNQLASGEVEFHFGDSSTEIKKLPNQYFDWVYIDAAHEYEGVRKDLWAIKDKMKDGGIIAFNDYIFFGTSDYLKYGVVEVVHEFCLEFDFEIIYMSLNGRSYNDVAIRKIGV